MPTDRVLQLPTKGQLSPETIAADCKVNWRISYGCECRMPQRTCSHYLATGWMAKLLWFTRNLPIGIRLVNLFISLGIVERYYVMYRSWWPIGIV